MIDSDFKVEDYRIEYELAGGVAGAALAIRSPQPAYQIPSLAWAWTAWL